MKNESIQDHYSDQEKGRNFLKNEARKLKATLSAHQAQSVYAYIKELEDYVNNCEGEEDLIKMNKSLNSGGKLRNGIKKLNVYNE